MQHIEIILVISSKNPENKYNTWKGYQRSILRILEKMQHIEIILMINSKNPENKYNTYIVLNLSSFERFL